MGDKSGIEWTDATWNPITGCTAISAGCDHCYAETLALRLQRMGVDKYRNGFDVTLHTGALVQPFRWRSPRRVFVNSMSDLFHAHVPKDFVVQVWEVMRGCPHHTFQVLTKRPERMARFTADYPAPPNVWLGTSVEDERVRQRIDRLRECGGNIRFLSCEPLIGPLPSLDLAGIHWVIVGGESGSRHRWMDPAWVRDIRDQSVCQGVPFFFKQWGGRTPKAGGRELDGQTWDEFPFGGDVMRPTNRLQAGT
ncbi:MAG: phage Gp37/Gp68 family protein [Chloroflexota bacterium]|nr:phage Gp37/Gp68 family protein [Chloroflexota bacterium]